MAAAAAVIDDDVEQSESSGYVSMETMPKGETLRLNLLLLDHIEDSSRHYFIPRKITKVQAVWRKTLSDINLVTCTFGDPRHIAIANPKVSCLLDVLLVNSAIPLSSLTGC